MLQTYFLNILLLVLIVSDIVALFIRLSNEKTITVTHVPLRATNCDSCVKPDVYLIIADEYTGNEVLKKNFGYDNHVFENALRQRGFHIAGNSRSNYNFTAYSLASLLSMEYLRNLEKDWLNHHDLFISRDLIKENSLVRYFRQSGYRFYNYSAFRFAGEENSITNAYFIKKSALYKSQTFISRFWRDVGFHFTPEDELMHTRKQHLYNNRINEKLLYQRVLIKEPQPKFVFTHLSMPHHPYHFDSTGKELPYYTLLNDSFRFNRNAYISYLVFTNHKLLALADHIKQKASRPYVLIILGDHGFRQYQDSRFNNDHFSNINAVYLPNQDYSRFYNGMTNVNLFRVILNTEFGQNLPLLKDSTRFTWEVEADMPPSK